MTESEMLSAFMEKIAIDGCSIELTLGYDKGYRCANNESMFDYLQKGKEKKVNVGFLEGIDNGKAPKDGKRSGSKEIYAKCLVTLDCDLKDNMEKGLFDALPNFTKSSIAKDVWNHYADRIEANFGAPLLVNFTGNGFHIHLYIDPLSFDKDVWKHAYANFLNDAQSVTGLKFDAAFQAGSQLKRIPLSWSFKSQDPIKGECLAFNQDANSTSRLQRYFQEAEATIKEHREASRRKALEKLSQTDDHKDQVKSMLFMADMCSHFGLDVPLRSPCRSPLRNDTNPSFSYNDSDKIFNDYAKNSTGDYFDFIGLAMGADDFPSIIKEAQDITGIEPTRKQRDYSHVPDFDTFKQNLKTLVSQEEKDYYNIGKMLVEAFDGFWHTNVYGYDNWKSFQEALEYDPKNQRRCMAYHKILRAIDEQGIQIQKPSLSVCGELYKLKMPEKKDAFDVHRAVEVWQKCVEEDKVSTRKVKEVVDENIYNAKMAMRTQRRTRQRRDTSFLSDI